MICKIGHTWIYWCIRYRENNDGKRIRKTEIKIVLSGMS